MKTPFVEKGCLLTQAVSITCVQGGPCQPLSIAAFPGTMFCCGLLSAWRRQWIVPWGYPQSLRVDNAFQLSWHKSAATILQDEIIMASCAYLTGRILRSTMQLDWEGRTYGFLNWTYRVRLEKGDSQETMRLTRKGWCFTSYMRCVSVPALSILHTSPVSHVWHYILVQNTHSFSWFTNYTKNAGHWHQAFHSRSFVVVDRWMRYCKRLTRWFHHKWWRRPRTKLACLCWDWTVSAKISTLITGTGYLIQSRTMVTMNH